MNKSSEKRSYQISFDLETLIDSRFKYHLKHFRNGKNFKRQITKYNIEFPRLYYAKTSILNYIKLFLLIIYHYHNVIVIYIILYENRHTHITFSIE